MKKGKEDILEGWGGNAAKKLKKWSSKEMHDPVKCFPLYLAILEA